MITSTGSRETGWRGLLCRGAAVLALAMALLAGLAVHLYDPLFVWIQTHHRRVVDMVRALPAVYPIQLMTGTLLSVSLLVAAALWLVRLGRGAVQPSPVLAARPGAGSPPSDRFAGGGSAQRTWWWLVGMAAVTWAGLVAVMAGALIWAPASGAVVAAWLGALAVALFAAVVFDRRFVPQERPTRLSPHDRLVLAALVVLSVVWLASDLDSWRYSCIGDEWAVFGVARRFEEQGLLAARHYFASVSDGLWGVHAPLLSATQAAVMRVVGVDNFGWRLTGVLVAALALVPFVVFAARHLGRAGLAVATALVVTSPLLFSETHTGYGWGQARLWTLSAMAALALTVDRGRVYHAALLGLFCALCSLISGLAVFVPPLSFGVLAVVLIRRCRTSGWRRSMVAWSGVLLIAAFAVWFVGAQLPTSLMPDSGSLLDDFKNTLWKTSLGPLIAHYLGPEWFNEHIRVTQTPAEFASTLGLLVVRSVLAPLTFMGRSHYVIGHVMDPIGGGLALVGMVATLVSGSLRRRSALVWVFFVPSLIVAGVMSPYHEYGDLRVTRLYLLVPFWAIFAGFGFEVVARAARVHIAPGSRRWGLVGGAAVVVMMVLWNIYAIVVRAPRDGGTQGPALAMKVLQQSSPGTEVLACFDVWFPLGPFFWAYPDQPVLRVVSETELEESMEAGASKGGPVYLFRVGMRDPERRRLCHQLLIRHSEQLSCLAMPDDRNAQILRCQWATPGGIADAGPWRNGVDSAPLCDRIGPW